MLRTDKFRIAMYPGVDNHPIVEISFMDEEWIQNSPKKSGPWPRNVYRLDNPTSKPDSLYTWRKISGSYPLDPKAILWQLVHIVLNAYREAEELIDLSQSQT